MEGIFEMLFKILGDEREQSSNVPSQYHERGRS